MDDALPKKARLDLLTQLTLDRLVKEHETKEIVDAVLRRIEIETDAAWLRELKVLWKPEALPPTPAGYSLVRTSDGKLWHVPTVNIGKAKQRDPKLQVLHVEHWRN